MSQTVLVADDSRTIRKIIEMALKAQPYTVVSVGSAQGIMEKARMQPSVILLDYYMPDANGYDLCLALKTNQSTRHIPVVMLGGTYRDFDEGRAYQSGADQILMKPFTTDQLYHALGSALRPAPAPASREVESVSSHAAPAGLAPSSSPSYAEMPPQPSVPVTPSDVTPPPSHVSQGARGGQFGMDGPMSPNVPGGIKHEAVEQPVAAQDSVTHGSLSEEQSQPTNVVQMQRMHTLDETSRPGATPPGVQSAPSPVTREISGPGLYQGAVEHTQGASLRTSGEVARQASPPVTSGQSSPSQGRAGDSLSRDEIKQLIQEEVRNSVREQLPSLIRNVMGEVFQQKVLPKLLKHGEDRIQAVFRDELENRVNERVRSELERLLGGD